MHIHAYAPPEAYGGDLADFSFEDLYRRLSMTMDIKFREDLCAGEVCVLDLQHNTGTHMAKITAVLPFVKNFFACSLVSAAGVEVLQAVFKTRVVRLGRRVALLCLLSSGSEIIARWHNPFSGSITPCKRLLHLEDAARVTQSTGLPSYFHATRKCKASR